MRARLPIEKIIPVVLFAVFLGSCKSPLPVYFDFPIGTKVQGFDTLISGNYIPLDDVLDKGTKEFSAKYSVGYDKILLKNISAETNGKEVNYEEIKDIIGVEKDSGKTEISAEKCDSVLASFCYFNELASTKLGRKIDKAGPSKPHAAMVKISYDRVFFIGIDSIGKNSRDTLLSLNANTLLTKYSGKYFLNFKTEYGWEIMQMDVWENKFLSVRPFYFTNYDGCAASVSELTASTKNIYPNMKPALNKERKLIGYNAAMNPKLLLDAFKKSESVIMMMKLE